MSLIHQRFDDITSSGPLCFSSVSISSCLVILLLLLFFSFSLSLCVSLYTFVLLRGRLALDVSFHLTTDDDPVFFSFFFLLWLTFRSRKEDKREDNRKMFCYHYPPANLHPSIASRLQSALELPGSFGPPSLTCECTIIIIMYLFLESRVNNSSLARRSRWILSTFGVTTITTCNNNNNNNNKIISQSILIHQFLMDLLL